MIVKTEKEYQLFLSNITNGSIGFVPTMGALHQGHLELVKRSLKENRYTAVSIFVNPTQFNNSEDFEKYPIQHQKDFDLLQKLDVDVIYVPDQAEMYPDGLSKEHNLKLGNLANCMEGINRPGHFDGVIAIVSRLFQHIQPNKAYFGEKDYQQLLVVKKLTQSLFPFIEIVPCPIVREPGGLAMSSRNMRLSPEQQQAASNIFKTLLHAKSLLQSTKNAAKIERECLRILKKNQAIVPEYFEIRCSENLLKLETINKSNQPRAFVAATVNNVRLIDNLLLID